MTSLLNLAAHGPAPPPVPDPVAPPPTSEGFQPTHGRTVGENSSHLEVHGAWDAIVLAGGRGSRLGGADKTALVLGGSTVLERVLDALDEASRVVVVGDIDVDRDDVTVVQEQPRFSGPAAAIGAGLAHTPSPWVFIAACDQPFLAEAVRPLLDARTGDGVVAVDAEGRRQHLTSIVRSSALRNAVSEQPTLTNCSVHALLAPLDLVEVPLSVRATHDVDTWHDLEELGVEQAGGETEQR